MVGVCRECNKQFEVKPAFRALLDLISPRIGEVTYKIPDPTLCGSCRYQRRIAHRNEFALFQRKCAATNKNIVSIYSVEAPYKVFNQSYWWSDAWDAKTFGRPIDLQRPFFDQFQKLQMVVPRLALVSTGSENSEYTNQCCDNKDCYLCACCSYNDKCLYGHWNQNSRECVDCYLVEKSELCIECTNGTNLYNCIAVDDSENSSNCYFSKGLKRCSYVIGGVRLRDANYIWFGEQLTPKEWEQRFAELVLTQSQVEEFGAQLRAKIASIPVKFYRGERNESFSGDYLRNTKDTYESFNCRETRDMWYSQDSWRAQNCSDITETLDSECSYEVEGAIAKYSCFITKSWPADRLFYCDLCFSSRNLFGCVGLRNAEYCILNQQYTKAEYEEVVPKLINLMQQTKEWGEHFPVAHSPFPYNDTIAQEYFPLSREEVLRRGWKWRDDTKSTREIDFAKPPDCIAATQDDITSKVIKCAKSGAPYRITALELSIYRKLGYPVPIFSPDVRRARRMAARNPRKLWARRCASSLRPDSIAKSMKCSEKFETTCPPELDIQVICEECFEHLI